MAQPAPSYEQSVFINCPYDQEYADLFCAVVLTTVAYGFEPRSAREAEHRSETRFVRITEALTHSKYSIHDLSRFTGEGVDNIARFNMPLELGIAMALKIERQATAGRPHNWLVLVPGLSNTSASFPIWPDSIPGSTSCRPARSYARLRRG